MTAVKSEDEMENAFVKNSCASAGVPVRETAAQEILRLSAQLAGRSEELVSQTQMALSMVMRREEDVCVDAGFKARDLPPLFSELYQQLERIACSLDSIEKQISRVDV